jgi:hypothetical protein
MTECTSKNIGDIGHGVSVVLRYIDGKLEGADYVHDCKITGASFLPIGLPDGWTLVSEEPLTLTPSVLCRSCGHHGFITDGKWVPA